MNYRYISEFKVDIENISKLHIGTGEERILLDDGRDKAYMPATSIAGTFRSYLEQNEEKECIKYLFGYQEKDKNYKSKVFVSDVFADLKENSICTMPSIRIDSKTGASEKNSKFEREYLNEGHKFELKFQMFSSEKDKEFNLEMIYKCLKALDNGEILIGGYTTYGAGEFKIKEAKKREYDLYNVDDFMSYLKKANLEYNNILEDIKKTDITNNFVEFELNAKIEEPILIGGQDQNDYEKPDKENIKDSNGNYIIPGSSLKGVFRQRARKILYYLNKEELLEYIFGTESNKSNNEDMKRSRVFFTDGVIDENGNKNIYYRIKIDKFTGGVMKGALLKERPVVGQVTIKLKYKKSKDEKDKDDKALGLLSLIFRDLAMGDLAIGSGSSIGRGRLKGEKFFIANDNHQTEIKFNKKDNLKYINKWIKSFNE